MRQARIEREIMLPEKRWQEHGIFPKKEKDRILLEFLLKTFISAIELVRNIEATVENDSRIFELVLREAIFQVFELPNRSKQYQKEYFQE